ncbi:MAG: dTDP-4-dehydrorhamnose reductase [Myxococcota bacterium]
MTRLLLTGASGQLAQALRPELESLGELIALDHAGLDLNDPDAIRARLRHHKPDVVVNAGAYTAVDRAESEPELAFNINAVAPGILAEETARLGAVLIHYSTDYVFDGQSTTPYREEDPTQPLNVYGETKLAGEEALAAASERWTVLRVSWLYDTRGHNFLQTMLRLAQNHPELRIVDDQIGAPTWVHTVARATRTVIQAHLDGSTEASGLYHLPAGGQTTWCRFAQAIFELAGLEQTPRVVPIPTSDYPTPAQRPAWSVLSGTRIHQQLGIVLPDWNVQLEEAFATAHDRNT